MSTDGERLVRAAYTADTITIYQAYGHEIADAALAAGTFVPPFSRDRMTWIKPSFGWMMHRSGWAAKLGQERIVSIEITRAGFEWALAHSCLSHYQPGIDTSPRAWEVLRDACPVRIQWDPDRALTGERLGGRAIQIGLSGEAVHRYCDEWIRSLTDMTPVVHETGHLIRAVRTEEAAQLLPAEKAYPLSPALSGRIGAEPATRNVTATMEAASELHSPP